VTTFLALTRTRTYNTPFALYMHENQLTYPLPRDPAKGAMRRQRGERDQHYVFVNYASMMAVNHICFNSQYHLESWFSALPNFLKHFPDHNELSSIEILRQKSAVLPVGITLPPPFNQPSSDSQQQPPLIVWNQRWEYDKNPEAFFAALKALKDLPFRVAILGENFSRQPDVFEAARAWLGERVVAFGFVDRARYWEILHSADLTLSTAWHEFFGISIIEAMACGVVPLLPRRLSYPELLPAPLHRELLYTDHADLIKRLRMALNGEWNYQAMAPQLQKHSQRYAWQTMATRYDSLFNEIGATILLIDKITAQCTAGATWAIMERTNFRSP
jgi:glycosyltransferase involved in cell wall biosynthesis